MTGLQVGVIASPCPGTSPSPAILPPLTIGRTMQSVDVVGGGMIQSVGAVADPALPILHSVAPWSNAQLWPAAAELSGTNKDPSVPVKVPGDQLATWAPPTR